MTETDSGLLHVDNMVLVNNNIEGPGASINRALLGTTAVLGAVGAVVGTLTEQATPVELTSAMVGTGLLLTLANNLPPILSRFSWGQRCLERVDLSMEEAQFAPEQKQRKIDNKNIMRAEKPLIKELVRRAGRITS